MEDDDVKFSLNVHRMFDLNFNSKLNRIGANIKLLANEESFSNW